MSRPAKTRIRQSFERAAPSYDAAAEVQRRICAQLAGGLPAQAPARWLDAGCGTGHALGLLGHRYPDSCAIALDLAGAMLARIAPPCLRVAGDLEALPLADASLDLYWSSLAVQWCDLPRALAEAARVLRDGGALRLASLGPATFHELRTAFAGIDDYRHTLAFHDAAQIARLAEEAGFSGVRLRSTVEIAHFPDLRALLRSVKAVGANQLGAGRRTGLMGRSTLARVEAAYEALRTPAGLPLSYDVILLEATR